jgi:hypothetical protein
MMRRALTSAGVAIVLTAAVAAQTPRVHKGLEMAAASVERATNVRLTDCPPGANTVGSTTKAGEEFAIVTVKMKVLPAFKPPKGPEDAMKRPVLADAAGKTYNTAVSFVDIGNTPEFSCAFPFRVPVGTAVKSLNIDGALLDLASFQK